MTERNTTLRAPTNSSSISYKVSIRKRFLLSLLVILAIAGIGGSYYFYKKYTDVTSNPNAVAQKEVNELVSDVGKLMMLPKDETPTVATISDKEKLSDQVFFKNAENNDKLLLYNVAATAILYRPQTKKIINVAPVSLNQPQNTNVGNSNTNQ